MRNLTISRRKNFVACLVTIKLCVEVSEGEKPDLLIGEKPCRVIGRLKNGKTTTIQVSEDAFTLYAISDERTTSYSRETYYVEAGTEDISLSGACESNVATGAFRFDDNNSEFAAVDREKTKGRARQVFISTIVVGIVAGLFSGLLLIKNNNMPKPKDFEVQNLIITLDQSFEEIETDAHLVRTFVSTKRPVSLTIEIPTESNGLETFSEQEIGNILISTDLYQNAKLVEDTENGLVYIQYENTEVSSEYIMVVKKNGNEIWLCHFGALSNYFDDQSAWIIETAKTIKFQ